MQLFKVKFGNVPFLMNEIFTMRYIPEDSVVTNLRSQSDFYKDQNLKVFDLEQKSYVP